MGQNYDAIGIISGEGKTKKNNCFLNNFIIFKFNIGSSLGNIPVAWNPWDRAFHPAPLPWTCKASSFLHHFLAYRLLPQEHFRLGSKQKSATQPYPGEGQAKAKGGPRKVTLFQPNAYNTQWPPAKLQHHWGGLECLSTIAPPELIHGGAGEGFRKRSCCE